MTRQRISLKGYTIDKDGNFVPKKRKESVSERIRKRTSKRVRVARPGASK